MNTATKYLIGFITLINVFIISSTYASDKFSPLTDHSPIQSTLGFSVTPPSGDNWFEKFEDHIITFVKKLESKTHTFFIKLEEIKTRERFNNPNEFLIYIKNKNDVTKSPDFNRFKNYKGDYKIDSTVTPYCVKYYENGEDHGVASLKDKILFIETKGIICLNPNNPELGVHIYYSDRYESNKKIEALQKTGEEVVNSLKLINTTK